VFFQFRNIKLQFNKNKPLYLDLFKLTFSFIIGFIFWISFRKVEPLEIIIKNSSIPFYITKSLLLLSQFYLKIIGYNSIIIGNKIQIIGAKGLHIIYGCLGISHIALFTGLIISYPGKIINKLWYIPLGILIIDIVNAFRLSMFTLAIARIPEHAELIHYYVTRITIYLSIFFMWIIWIRFFSLKKRPIN
jgi:exosortase/archaeosortase family protein